MNINQEDSRKLLEFARKVIAASLSRSPLPPMPEVPGIHTLGACFVTLHDDLGRLRGCIGNIQAVESLGDNIRHNAINAAFNDPRFPRLSSTDELNTLTLEISVLSAPEEIASSNDFIVGKHGIILSNHGRSAVFLPQVAPEQGWDRQTTLEHLALKAGLPHDSWREASARFYVFEAFVFSEDKSQDHNG